VQFSQVIEGRRGGRELEGMFAVVLAWRRERERRLRFNEK